MDNLKEIITDYCLTNKFSFILENNKENVYILGAFTYLKDKYKNKFDISESIYRIILRDKLLNYNIKYELSKKFDLYMEKNLLNLEILNNFIINALKCKHFTMIDILLKNNKIKKFIEDNINKELEYYNLYAFDFYRKYEFKFKSSDEYVSNSIMYNIFKSNHFDIIEHCFETLNINFWLSFFYYTHYNNHYFKEKIDNPNRKLFSDLFIDSQFIDFLLTKDYIKEINISTIRNFTKVLFSKSDESVNIIKCLNKCLFKTFNSGYYTLLIENIFDNFDTDEFIHLYNNARWFFFEYDYCYLIRNVLINIIDNDSWISAKDSAADILNFVFLF